MAWKGTDNLKPLQPDIYGTGRWGYAGQALTTQDVENLTKKGVDWVNDIMPDGRLKHPKFRLKRIRNRQNALTEARQYTAEKTEELKERYDALPEPRPPFFQWAAGEEVATHYANVKRIAMHATRDSDRIKACAVLLEHGLVKPKSVVENTNKTEDAIDLPLDKLADLLLVHLGPEVMEKKLNAYKANLQ